MSSSNSTKPLELDAVLRSIRPHVKTPDQPVAITASTAAEDAPEIDNAPMLDREADIDETPAAPVTIHRPMTSAAGARKPRRADRDGRADRDMRTDARAEATSEGRVQVDLVPAAGEATVGVYMRLPKSVHQQLKTVVFQNQLTEQGHQSIADITREAITEWLARNRTRTLAA